VVSDHFKSSAIVVNCSRADPRSSAISRALSQLLQGVTVMDLKIVAVARQEARPIPALRHRGWFVVRRPALLIGHLEEEQKRELLDVVAVGKPVIPQDVSVVPAFLDKLAVCHGCCPFLS
jgi:hypothetical protein